jgi:hypothetical protein
MAIDLGQKYVVIDEEGRAVAFYAANFNSSIPPEAVPISDAVWAEWSAASQRKLWAGGELLDVPEAGPGPAPIPSSITARQARLALLQADLLDQVDAAVAKADRAAQVEWQYASTIDRHSTLVASLAASVPLTDAQLDQLFKAAAAL